MPVTDQDGRSDEPLLCTGKVVDEGEGGHAAWKMLLEDAVPAVCYLALKYHDDPETALIVNTNLGGDNAARGAVLGALLGACHGIEKFPDRWIQGLLEPLPDLNIPDRNQRPPAELRL